MTKPKKLTGKCKVKDKSNKKKLESKKTTEQKKKKTQPENIHQIKYEVILSRVL